MNIFKEYKPTSILPPFDFTLAYLVTDYLQGFKSGEQLMNQRSLSDEIGVSRQVLREALMILDSHDVINIHHGKLVKFVSLNRPSLLRYLVKRGLVTPPTS